MGEMVNFRVLEENNEYMKVQYNGISLLDVQDFLSKIEYYKRIYIFEEVPYDSLFVFKNLKDVKFKHHIKKKRKKIISATDCVVVLNTLSSNIFEKNINSLFEKNEFKYYLNDIRLLCYFHDFDWMSIIIFSNKLDMEEFHSFILKKYVLVNNEKGDVYL